MTGKKCLIVYFSRKGDNYVSGKIVNLPVGNTEVAARMIREVTGGDLFEIEPVNPYPGDYVQATEVAKVELEEHARPAIARLVPDIAAYDVVFLGYPNWWNTFPMPVATFLERHQLAGNTIAPFCTHEGSGLGRSERDLAKLCPAARIVKGLAIQGSNVRAARKDIEKWLKATAIIAERTTANA